MFCCVMCRKFGCIRSRTAKIFQIIVGSVFFVSFVLRPGSIKSPIAKKFDEISKIPIIFFNSQKTWEENVLYRFDWKIALHLKFRLQKLAMESHLFSLDSKHSKH